MDDDRPDSESAPEARDSGAPGTGSRDAVVDASACMTAIERFDDLVATRTASSGSCVGDEDCALVTPESACANRSLSIADCPIAVSEEGARALEDDLASFKGALCPLSCGIGGVADCKPLVARCVEGRCAAVVSFPP